MKEKNDVVAKNFEAYPDVAADIINVWLNRGEHGVCKEDIFPAPTETVYQGNDAMHSQLEDVSKYEVVNGKIQAQYLFANQTGIDHRMLLRKAGYTGAAYKEQYDGKVSDMYPVMELVLYWGNPRWSSSQDMQELFRESKIPQATWEYIDNLKLHVWDMRRLPKELREHFTSDMRIVVDFLAEGNGYRSERKVVHKEALVKMLRVLSGEENVDDTATMLETMNIKEEDDIMVCELFNQYISQGISQGVRQGIEALIITCKELGADFEETEEKVRVRFHLTDEEVQENMELYW